MNHKIKSLLLFIAFANFVLATAQNNDSIVHRSVNVSREFQPVINDAGKIISTPKIIEPMVDKSAPIYSDITTPLSMKYNIHLLKSEELLNTPPLSRKGFLRLGLGYPINTLGNFMYPIWNDEKNRLDFSINHLGAFVDKKHSKTTASLQYNHLFKNFDLYTGMSGRHDFFNYYGRSFASEKPVILSDVAQKYGNETFFQTSELDQISLYNLSAFPLTDTHWRFHTHAGARSLPLADNLIFDANINFDLFKSVSSNLTENQILMNGLFNVPFDRNRLGLNFEIYNFRYNKDISKDFSSKENYSVIKLNPFWKITGDNWFLKLGAKTGISIGQGQIFTPSPDVAAQWNIQPDYLAVYGAVTGDLSINSLSKIYDENRYISSNVRIDDTYTPIDAYAGFKLSPIYNLMFDFFGQFKIIDNQYFYINRHYSALTVPANSEGLNFNNFYYNRFDVLYSSASRASVGLRTAWDYKDKMSLYLKAAYHHWNVKTEPQAWHLPTWDADFGANVKLTNDISINTQFIFQEGRYSKLSDANGTKMTPVLDWNLGASYAYRDWFSVFAKFNNILNKKYDFYSGYDVQGMNVMLGTTLSF